MNKELKQLSVAINTSTVLFKEIEKTHLHHHPSAVTWLAVEGMLSGACRNVINSITEYELARGLE